MPQRRAWSADEIAVLRDSYRSVPDRRLAERLGRTSASIRRQLQRLGLAREILVPFTPDEDEALRAAVADAQGRHYHGYPVLGPLAHRLGRSVSSICDRMRKLGLSLRSAKSSGRHAGRKVAGWRPNKSGRGPIYEHTAVMERVLQRSVLPGECVHHIDGDKDNNEPDNLYLCRSRSEHRRIHHQLNGLAGELLRRGILRFDRTKGMYELCETSR